VHLDLSYRVGSSHEEPGRSGFAHLFEHMMFQGSLHVGDDEHIQIMEEAGGYANASTTADFTHYVQTFPENHLETALWLESDRMGFLLPAVTPGKFEIQRAAVTNERLQRSAGPLTSLGDAVAEHLYPEGHPYSWPVIGWPEDLERASLDDVKRFFLRWYGPNNAVLTIAGDFDTPETLEDIEKYFGGLPAGPDMEEPMPELAKLEADRYVTFEDDVPAPSVMLVYPTVPASGDDVSALAAGASLVALGPGSALSRALVDGGVASAVAATHDCLRWACGLTISMAPAPETSLTDLVTAARTALGALTPEDVSEGQLEAYGNALAWGGATAVQSVAGKASLLSSFELLSGSPAAYIEEQRRAAAVTPEDMVAALVQYAAEAPALVVSVVPRGQAALAAGTPNHDPPPHAVPDRDREPVVEREVRDGLDRSRRPSPGEVGPVRIGEHWEAALDNGVAVVGVSDHETPVTLMGVCFNAGSRDEPQNHRGVAALTTALLQESTADRSAAEFSAAVDRLGAQLIVGGDVYQSCAVFTFLTEHIDRARELMRERLLSPGFLPDEFERLKGLALDSARAGAVGPRALGASLTSRLLYGSEGPLADPPQGWAAALADVTLDDVKAFYQDELLPHLFGIVVSSSLEREAVLEAVEPFGALAVEPRRRSPLPASPEIAERTIYLIDAPGAAQASVNLVQKAVPFDAFGDYYLAGVANYPLGGSTFTNRLTHNLRETRGFTYGISSGFTGDLETGYFGVNASVKADAVADAIGEIVKELERYDADGMSSDEFDFTRKAIRQQEALAHETPGAKLTLANQALRHGVSLDYPVKQYEILDGLDRDALNQVASSLLDPEHAAIVVLADAQSSRPALEALGYPIETPSAAPAPPDPPGAANPATPRQAFRVARPMDFESIRVRASAGTDAWLPDAVRAPLRRVSHPDPRGGARF
jgi:zinc protease